MTDTTAPTENNSEKPNSEAIPLESKRDFLRALILCVVAVVIVRSFLFEPFKIPSSSMIPTLKIGDHIFVSKFNFGLSIPFTKIQFINWGEPKRGEIIVFLFPREESLHYIKRVIGVPGDTIEYFGREVLINGTPIPKEILSDEGILSKITDTDDSKESRGTFFKESLGEHFYYVRHSRANSYEFNKFSQSKVVPPGNYFVMGDNRDESYDSRSWDFVPIENIKGKAVLVWLSLDQKEAWGKWSKIRWSRCGTLIQ